VLPAQVELPLGATEDRICGTIDIEKALQEGIKAYEPGLLVCIIIIITIINYACFHMFASSSIQQMTDSMTVSPCEPHCYSHTDAGALLCTNVKSCICLSWTKAAQQRTVSHPCRLQALQCMQDTRSKSLFAPSDGQSQLIKLSSSC